MNNINKSIWRMIILLLVISCSGTDTGTVDSHVKEESPRMQVVRTFLDNVLEKGRDRWSGKNTPLLADGINVDTGDPVEWVYRGKNGPDGRWIIHNLASQQNLFRTLVAFTNLTGEKMYREAAENAIRYHFDNLQSECGLLHWGGHQILDLRTLQPAPYYIFNPPMGESAHEFKYNFPFYDLLWQVDKEATRHFIHAFWNAHILDWGNLDMNRHGKYGLPMGKLWESTYRNPEPFYEGKGLSFINAGSDLIYAGSMLYVLDHEEDGALKWAKRMAELYVKARHPVTGLGDGQYSKLTRTKQPPAEGEIPNRPEFGDRAENQFGKDFPGVAREGWALFGRRYTMSTLIQLELAERLGEAGQEFLNTTVAGLKAYAKYGYMPDSNRFRPMWADGTDLTGYVFPRGGYFGEKGKVLKTYEANEFNLFAYARAYRMSKDPELWKTVRSIMQGLGLGDPGVALNGVVELNKATDNADPIILFTLLEMYRISGERAYLDVAEIVADNIIAQHFRHGFFLPDENHVNANFCVIEPLALLSLEAALQGKSAQVPVFSGNRSYIHAYHAGLGRTYDSEAIWSVTRDGKASLTSGNH